MQLKRLEQRHGIVLEAARRDWYGHGPASSFFASGTILLLKSWKGAAESDRTSAASALLLLPVHAHRDPASVPVCVHFSGSWEHAGAAEKGHTRVRHFHGVMTFPVMKRAARGVGRGSEARLARRTRRGFAGAACLGSVADGLLRVGARAHFGRCCMRRCVRMGRTCSAAVGRLWDGLGVGD